MKGYAAITCLCWLLAGAGLTLQTLSESSGQTFTYEVESTVLSGIPELANQYSAISFVYKLKVDVVGKNKAVFKLNSAAKVLIHVGYEDNPKWIKSFSPDVNWIKTCASDFNWMNIFAARELWIKTFVSFEILEGVYSACKIQDVRVGKLNEEVPVSYAEDIEFQHTPSPLYERELSKPIIVHFEESQVTKFEAQKTDPIWSVNIKKALVEKFQVDLKKHNVHSVSSHNQVPKIDLASSVYTGYEDGIGGECETRYSILSVKSLDHPHTSENVLNVTKVKNYRNCRSRPVFETDNFEDQGCSTLCEPKNAPISGRHPGVWREASSIYESGCRFGFEPDHHPVKSYAIVWYNISYASHIPILEGILAEGKTSYNLNGKEIMVIAQQNITLVKKTTLRAQIPTIPNPVTYDSLEYTLPEEDYLDTDDSRLYALMGPIDVQDVVQVVYRHLESVVNDIIPDEPETSQAAGTKIILLVNAVDVLKRLELETIYKQLESESVQKIPRKQNMMRKVFLDVLAITSSDEIALFVRDLITSKRVAIWEAAELVEGVGKNIDDPSEEVIEAYIKLLDRPRVQQSRRLHPAVGITLGKMIEESCVNKEEEEQQVYKDMRQQQNKARKPRSLRKSYEESQEQPKKYKEPKQPMQEQDDEECTYEKLQHYIKLIAQKLREVKTFNKIMTYVQTLAHTGTPLALPYLKPYLTGEAPNVQALNDEDTDFLQTAAIYALHNIAEDYPDEVLPHVVSLYFDPSEDYETRIAAFSVIVSAEPPLNLLERIFTELHDEDSNQVGSYVYSRLSNLANSTLPTDRKMAQKIQLVFSHAPDFDLGMQFSNTFMYTTYDDDNDYGLSSTFKYVASNVSNIPRAFFKSIDIIRGPFQDNLLKLSANIKGVDELFEKLMEPSGVLTQILSSFGSNVQVRNIPEVLDIVKSRLLFSHQDIDIPRATLYYKLFGRTTYLTLDEQYFIEIIEHALEFFRQIDSTSGYTSDYVKVWMPSSFFRVVPSTVGLPVVINHRNPIILTLSLGNARVSTNQKKQTPMTSTLALSTDIHASIHMASIALAYVVDHANDEIYGAALEKTSEVALASEIEVVVDLQKDTYALKLKPKLPHEIFYHETRPSTFIAKAVIIDEPKEEWLDNVNEIETIPEPFKFENHREARAFGLSLRVVGESENPWADIPLWLSDTADDEGIFAAFLEMAVNPEMINRELHVYLEPHRKNPAAEMVFTVDYEKHLKLGLPKGIEQSKESSSSEEEEYEKAVTSIYGRSYSIPDAQSTIEKLINKTQATWAPVLGEGYSEPVPATVSHVLDITLAVKSDHTKHHAWRAVYAHSLGFRSNYFQLVGHRSSDEHDKPWQFCSSLVAVFPEMPNPFYMQMNTLKAQKAKFEAEIGWGTDCQRENNIRIEGVMEKSEQQLTTSSGIYESEKDQQSLPWYYKQCQIHRTEGQTQSYACQLAIAEDSALNVIKMDIISPAMSDSLRNFTYKLDLMTKYAFYSNLEANHFVTNPDDRVSIELHYSEQVPEIPLIDVYIHKPTETLAFTKLWLPFYEPPSTLDSYEDVFMDQFFNEDYTSECNVMEDFLNTFDNVTIELPDNQCQYVLAKDCSPEKAYTILASQIDLEAKTKAISMALAGHVIKALPPRGEVVPVVLNGKEHFITPSKPQVLDFDKETELRVYVRETVASTDTPILVVETSDGMHVHYDGKNIIIQLPRYYQGQQCGMCGDFNDEEFQEFIGPNGCLYVEEEDFANSYAVPGQSCPEPPKPTGPASCPLDVTYAQKKNLKFKDEDKQTRPKKHLPNQSSEEDVEPQYKRPIQDSQERIVPPRVPKPHPKKFESQSGESNEQPSKKRPTQDSEESEEDNKPAGHPDCIRAYTPTFDHPQENKICFATELAYRCKSECRAVQTKPVQMPFHCLPKSVKYEEALKDQARHGIVQQVQNKKPEKFRMVEIPIKCLST